MDKWLYRISLIFVVVGLLVSIYMTIYKVTSNDALCLGSGDCSTVNTTSSNEQHMNMTTFFILVIPASDVFRS